MKNTLQPSHMIALGVCAMLGAGFLAVVHVGSAKRQVRGMEYGFGTRKAPEPAKEQGLVADFKQGAAEISDKAGDAVHDFFGWGDSAPAGDMTASAKSSDAGADGGGDDGKDPFEDFYNKNYGKGSGGSSSASGGGWSDGGGGWGGTWSGSGGSSTSGGWGGGDEAKPASGGSSAKEAKEAAGDDEAGGKAPRANRPYVEDGSGDWVKMPWRGKGGRKGGAGSGGELASLPQGGGSGAADLGGPSIPSAGGKGDGKGGSLSGMPGQKGAVDLDGPDEKASKAAQSNYNSSMGANAGAVASGAAGAAGGGGGGGGGSVPAASAPKEVSPDGKDGDKKDGDKKDGEKKEEKSSFEYRDSDYPELYASAKVPAKKKAAAPGDPGFLQIITEERLKGKEGDFIAEDAASAQAEERDLRAGAVVTLPKEKRLLADGTGEEEEKPDPEKLADLSAARKKELKSEVHTFLKKIENSYGAMTQIFYTSCKTENETCSKAGLTEGFITMHTADSRVQVGLKYSKGRWAPCTISFNKAIKMQYSPQEPAGGGSDDNDDGGNDDGGDAQPADRSDEETMIV